MAKQCRAVSYLRGHLWENTFQGCHKAWAPRAARTIRPLKPERPAQVPGTRAASRVRDSAPGARGGTGPWAGFRTFTCSCALVPCPLSGPPPRREGLGAQHPRQEALVARLLRLTPEHMSGFCSVSGISETPLSHVCLEAGDRQAFLYLIVRSFISLLCLTTFFCKPGHVLWRLFIPLGVHACSSTRPSFIH